MNCFTVDIEVDMHFLNYLQFIGMDPPLHSNLPLHKKICSSFHYPKKLNVLKLPNECSDACCPHTVLWLLISLLYLIQLLLYTFLAAMFILQERAQINDWTQSGL